MRVTASADRVDERVEAVLLALFARPDFLASVAAAHDRRAENRQSGPDIGSLIEERERELDEVEALREEGSLTLRAYAAETKRIEAAIEKLRSSRAASVSSLAVRRMLTAPTLEEGWSKADLLARREMIRALLDVSITRAQVRGRKFDSNRVIVVPSRFLVEDSLRPDASEPLGSNDLRVRRRAPHRRRPKVPSGSFRRTIALNSVRSLYAGVEIQEPNEVVSHGGSKRREASRYSVGPPVHCACSCATRGCPFQWVDPVCTHARKGNGRRSRPDKSAQSREF